MEPARNSRLMGADMATARYVEAPEFITYDGTNGQAIADFITNLEIVSEANGVLELSPPNYPPGPPERTFYVGDKFSIQSGQVPAAVFPELWMATADIENSEVEFPADKVGTSNGQSIA